MSNVNETLDKRGEVYGKFSHGITLEAEILSLIKGRHYAEHGTDMDIWYEVAISKIVMKISRLAVSPKHIDSWHDIAGYAVLVEQTLKENTNA
jgi:hypothetical protein